MNVVMTQDTVKASKIGGQQKTYGSHASDKKDDIEGSQNGNENNNIKTVRPKLQTDNERHTIHEQLEDLMEMNRLLKKQLESRDSIIKKQISEIHRLQGQNKVLSEEKGEMKKENDKLMKECKAEQWLGERLKHDIRDLQIQLDFQDCYLQEQAHQRSLMSTLVDEVQKNNNVKEKEIAQLRKQLQFGKEKVDNEIEHLQKILGIHLKIPK